MKPQKNFTKALFEKWIKALKSGKYVQGEGHLCSDGKYCCLGVLASVAGYYPVDEEVLGAPTDFYASYSKGAIDPALIPGSEFRKGKSLSLFWLAPKVEEKLFNMNDGGKSFKQIAKHLSDWGFEKVAAKREAI